MTAACEKSQRGVRLVFQCRSGLAGIRVVGCQICFAKSGPASDNDPLRPSGHGWATRLLSLLGNDPEPRVEQQKFSL